MKSYPQITSKLKHNRADRFKDWSQLLFGFVFCWFTVNAHSAENQTWGFFVRFAEAYMNRGVVNLNTFIDYRFSPMATEALDHGVPLTLELQMEVQQLRTWWWNETVASLKQRFILRYHSLSRQYVVQNLNSGEQLTFPTKRAALHYLSYLRALPIIDQSLLDKDAKVRIYLRVLLDIESLPVPLRLQAYFSSQWRLISPWNHTDLP